MRLSCFVGHLFNRQQIDDLRPALRDGVANFDAIELYFADEVVASGRLLDKITQAIDRSFICIFDLSENKSPNVFLELGYALGKSKCCLLLLRSGSVLPADLEGHDRIEYESYTHLSQQLRQKLPSFLTARLAPHEPIAELNGIVLGCLADVNQGDSVPTETFEADAKKAGASQDDVAKTLEGLERLGVIRLQNGAFTMMKAREISVILGQGR